jgi:hypothetical protein
VVATLFAGNASAQPTYNTVSVRHDWGSTYHATYYEAGTSLGERFHGRVRYWNFGHLQGANRGDGYALVLGTHIGIGDRTDLIFDVSHRRFELHFNEPSRVLSESLWSAEVGLVSRFSDRWQGTLKMGPNRPHGELQLPEHWHVIGVLNYFATDWLSIDGRAHFDFVSDAFVWGLGASYRW